VVDLTCQHKNQTLLVEGPEIKIRPVGARQWSVRERFGAEELREMIFATLKRARQIAESRPMVTQVMSGGEQLPESPDAQGTFLIHRLRI
jgi:hypothetical protein